MPSIKNKSTVETPKAGGGSGGRGKDVKSMKTQSKRAGLLFPVSRVGRQLRIGKYSPRVGAGAPIFLASVLEYLTAEILELAGNAARDNKKLRIIPRHILLAIKNDDELSKLFDGITIAEGGVLPNINSVLVPKSSTTERSTKTKYSKSALTSKTVSSVASQ
jgi:histone H2A